MRYLITSALPYINGVKHLGNLVGSMLPADVYARFLRANGEDVLFICATDEHGTPAELAAADEGLDVAEYCRRQHIVQAELGDRFGLSFDHFGRSSSVQNHELTQHFANRLDQAGLLEERVTRQLYSVTDQRFLPDRYVIGTCPYCGYDRARGDQCENCTRVLEPTNLINPRSAISGSEDLEIRESRHLFLLQSRLADAVRTWLESKVEWPLLARSIGLKWLNEGLEDRSITRDLKWGVPVNRPGFENKVFYVWFDAPIAYIGATWEWADAKGRPDAWRSWWYDADDVQYIEFMAKDNVPFHTISFPCTLIGSQEPWKLVDYLKSMNWLTYYGGKFSTSQGVGVDMRDALELLPADYWRYYLISNSPESDDVRFTWDGLANSVNKDLADTFGNFVNRTLTLVERNFGTIVPSGGSVGDVEQRLEDELTAAISAYSKHLETMEFRKAAHVLRGIWSRGNEYLEEKSPWRTIKSSREDTAACLRTAINLIALFARLSDPIIPSTSTLVLDCLGVGTQQTAWPRSADLTTVAAGTPFRVPAVLFRKLTDDDIGAWTARFGGG